MLISSTIHVAVNGIISFFFIHILLCVYTHTHTHTYIYISHILIHSSVNGHLVCFQILASEKSAAMNLRVHVSFQIIVLLGYIPKSGFSGTHNSIFSLLRNVHTVFHSGCTNLRKTDLALDLQSNLDETQMHGAEQNMLDRKDHMTSDSISMNFLEKRPRLSNHSPAGWLPQRRAARRRRAGQPSPRW